MSASSVVDGNDGWREASEIQRRPHPRRITVGDFLATSVSNKFGALEDNGGERRRKQKNSQPLPVPKTVREVTALEMTTRATSSFGDMTLDELDRAIKEEEAKFVTTMGPTRGTDY
jgi:hypothetical protein